jgi:hypothetical protein
MTASTSVEYCLLKYVPNIISDKSVSIAAIVISPGDSEAGLYRLIYATDWHTRVLVLDPDADLKVLDALLSEIRDRLLSPSHRSDMIRQLEDSFSNAIQISQRRKCPRPLMSNCNGNPRSWTNVLDISSELFRYD